MIQKMMRQLHGMEILFVYTMFLICISSRIASANEDEMQQIKPRRGGTVGLFAFPRVGRSDPDLSYKWDGAELPPSVYYEDYEMPSHEVIKRPSIIAFPRVGRSEKAAARYVHKYQETMKRAENGAGGSMWFGPRLGRVQKRTYTDKENMLQD